MLLPAFLFAVVTAGAYSVTDMMGSWRHKRGVTWSLLAGLIIFLVTLVIAWYGLWHYHQPLMFSNVFWYTFVCLLIGTIVGGIKNGLTEYNTRRSHNYGSRRSTWQSEESHDSPHKQRTWTEPGALVFGLAMIGWLIFGAAHGIWSIGGADAAKRLASQVEVTEQPFGEYPETDTEHMLLVPEEAARTKAGLALSQPPSGDYQTISTRFEVRDGALQSIDGHLFWAFDLKFNSWRNANRENRTVPGYILVDAEDPNAGPQLKLGFTMKWTPGAPTDSSIDRLIWTKYRSYEIDDLTLEIRDDGQPFYTATLNKPAHTWGKTVPQMTIVVDPQTGEIVEFPLDSPELPEWIDRIYSDDTVKQLMNWWGHWGDPKANYRWCCENKANRWSVSGNPTLVYVADEGRGHPEWQMLMTSWSRDDVASFVVLFNGRDNTARLYRVPELQVQSSVAGVFRDNPKNLVGHDPVHLSLHQIYGHLTWVASYIPKADSTSPKTLANIGLMRANAVSANNVQVAGTKEEVLVAYRNWLSGNQSTADPATQAESKTRTGTIAFAAADTSGGLTHYLIILVEDPDRIYSGTYDGAKLELPFAPSRVGKRVTIEYTETEDRVLEIRSYDDLELAA